MLFYACMITMEIIYNLLDNLLVEIKDNRLKIIQKEPIYQIVPYFSTNFTPTAKKFNCITMSCDYEEIQLKNSLKVYSELVKLGRFKKSQFEEECKKIYTKMHSDFLRGLEIREYMKSAENLIYENVDFQLKLPDINKLQDDFNVISIVILEFDSIFGLHMNLSKRKDATGEVQMVYDRFTTINSLHEIYLGEKYKNVEVDSFQIVPPEDAVGIANGHIIPSVGEYILGFLFVAIFNFIYKRYYGEI